MVYLRRKIDNILLDWKHSVNRKPLVIKGARQVGKTNSIRNFAKNNYKNFIEINFALEPVYKQIVEDGYSVVAVIKNISRINSEVNFIPNNTLIFFDEVQEFPDIMTTLKSFAMDGQYDVICSGSLLGIHYKAISSISVGYKEEIEMKSFDFEEFLWALGHNDDIRDDIVDHIVNRKPFSDNRLKLYNDVFMDYCIVGGMPDVVRDYVENRNFSSSQKIQKQIVIGYEDDIRKYAIGVDKSRISNVFRSIPFQLGKENKKFQISKIGDNARFKDYRGSIEWLEDAGIINISRALQTPNLPIKGNVVDNACVIYYADSGLLLSQLDDEAQVDFRQNKNMDVYKGGLFESIIAEALAKQGYELRYYNKENSTLREEFFVRFKDNLVPIEVKASNKASKSLSALIKNDKYPEINFGIKFIKGNIGFNSQILTLPHFCAFVLKEYFNKIEKLEI